MQISPISFGKKIPQGKCLIKDLRQNKPIEATIVEFDCQDASDIDEVKKINDGWIYKEDILSRMANVFNTKHYRKSSMAFYALENQEGEIIGITQIKKEKPEMALNYIESEHRGRYKYIGQNLISFLCKTAIENGYNKIYIPVPTSSAHDFYIKKCGFREYYNDWALYLTGSRIKRAKKRIDKRLPKI